MRINEFNKRFYKPHVPELDSDMIPVLYTTNGVFTPPKNNSVNSKCLLFKNKQEAIDFWVERGYKVFVLTEKIQ